MAEAAALVSPHSSTRECRRRNWAVAGAALFSLFVVAAYIHPSTLPVSLRSKTVIPDAGLDGPLNPTSAAMKVIAPDMFFATVATTEGHFTIQVTRSWAPHAADRFYNLAKNGLNFNPLAGFYNGCLIFDVEPRNVVKFGIPANPALSYQWMYGMFGTEIRQDAPHDRNAYTHLRVAFVDATGSEPTTQIKINLAREGFQGYNPSEAVAFGKVTDGQYDTIANLYSKYGSDVSVSQLISGGAKYAQDAFPRLSKITSIAIDSN